MSTPPPNPPNPPSLLAVESGHVGSLALLVYEICLTFDDEVNIIWSKSNSSWVKWQFLFTRYFALAAQIANRTIETIATSRRTIAPPPLRIWYMSQVITGCLLMSAVEVALMARVYALYRKNIWIGLVFVGLIISEFVTVIVGIVMSAPGRDFGTIDVLLTSPKAYTYFGVCAIVSQITILILMLLRYRTARAAGWGKAPVMMLTVRDGTVVFLVLLVITSLTLILNNIQGYALIGNSWFLSIVACAGCRLIINMQHLPARISTDRQTTIQLTTLCNGFDETHQQDHEIDYV